jgi:hypothetical protein
MHVQRGPLSHKQGGLIHQFGICLGRDLKIKLLLLLYIHTHIVYPSTYPFEGGITFLGIPISKTNTCFNVSFKLGGNMGKQPLNTIFFIHIRCTKP